MRRQIQTRPAFTEATVPLRREYLRQASLFETKLYYLPTVTPGQRARVYDADDWRRYNGCEGTVTHYSYFTGLHAIAVERNHWIYDGHFLGREIMNIR